MKVSLTQAARSISTVQTRKISAKAQNNENFDSHYINYFNRCAIEELRENFIMNNDILDLILTVGRLGKEWVTLQLWIWFLIHRLLLLLSELAGGLMISP